MTDLATRVSVPPQVMCRELCGEAILLELESGTYFGLDEVGTRIWLSIQRHGGLRPVLDDLLAEYDVGEDQLRRDLLAFVDRLVAQRLLEVDG